VPARVAPGQGFRLYMTADAVGGVWTYALDLARGLARHGVETTLAVLGPKPSEDQQAEAESIPALRLLATGLPLDWIAEEPRAVEQAGAAVAALAAETGADVVHLNSPALAAEADFPAPIVAACHSCVATWWQAVRSGPLPPEFAWCTDRVRQAYARADALVAPTAAFAATTAHAYGLPRPPAVVHNGRGTCPAEPIALRGEPFVFTAGRLWDDGKNVAALDRAAARLSAPVLAAGPLEGPNSACIRLSHIRPLGRLSGPEIAGYLASAPVFASVAYYEPFGLAVLEAAQAGCALVLADIPTFRELWDGAAVFVPPDDDAALTAALRRLLHDSVARQTLGAAARERSARYTVEAMTAGMLNIYRAVLPQAAVRSREAAA
jgi:glycosyltransferase involved in cell wall biosynthesis